MNFSVLGISHKDAPIHVREQIAFGPQESQEALNSLAAKFADFEFEGVLLSTCNRTEFYVAADKAVHPEIVSFLTELKSTNEFIPFLYQKDGKEAVEHLFCVAASLDSMLIGETQILSQVKTAYQRADEIGTTGPVTHAVFQSALKIAKMVGGHTGIHKHRLSLASVAIGDFAMQIFERLDNKKTLILGAGEMAEETLPYLKEHGCKSIFIANRSHEKAVSLSEKCGGIPVSWEDRFNVLKDADLVVSTTGAAEPIVTLADYTKIELQRAGRTLFVLDLAVPRDFDAEINKRDNVFLYSLDDLRAACEANKQRRNKELPKAFKIVSQESERFLREYRHRKTGAIIQQLRGDWEKTKEAELSRLLQKMPDLDEKGKELVKNSFDRLLNKLLHPPMESLRDESEHGAGHQLLKALSRLFRLED